MYDLIYGADESWPLIQKEFPSAVREDARDETHEERFGITFPKDEPTEDTYLCFLFKNKLAACSFMAQILRYQDPQRLMRVIEKAKGEPHGDPSP